MDRSIVGYTADVMIAKAEEAFRAFDFKAFEEAMRAVRSLQAPPRGGNEWGKKTAKMARNTVDEIFEATLRNFKLEFTAHHVVENHVANHGTTLDEALRKKLKHDMERAFGRAFFG